MLTSADLLQLSGITPRQLQWWSERKFITRVRRGRKFSKLEALEILIFATLRVKGLRLQTAKKFTANVHREFVASTVHIRKRNIGRPFLALVGSFKIEYKSDADSLIEWACHQREGIRMIDVTDLWNKIEKKIEQRA